MTSIIEKWFDLLNLPTEWKDEVMNSAKTFDPAYIDAKEEPYSWLFEQEDKKQALLYALCKCEDFYLTAKKRDIPDDILLASLTEVKRYALEYYNLTKGEKIGIQTIKWIGKILNGNIYRLGRLEFEIRTCVYGWPKHNIAAEENVIAVHIPDNGGPFTEEACNEAYRLSKEFFAKYFPEYDYKAYVCSSWMLDPTLKQFLKPTSNIVRFMNTFDVVKTTEAYSSLIFLFGRGTEISDLKNITPTTSLQKSVIDHLLSGGKMYSGYGFKEL